MAFSTFWQVFSFIGYYFAFRLLPVLSRELSNVKCGMVLL